MKYQDGFREEKTLETGETKSLKERAKQHEMKRRQEVRSKLIFLNSAIALIVIMIVLIAKVVSLQQVDSPKVKSTSTHPGEEKSSPKKTEQVAVTPTPVVTVAPAGSKQWLRTNLDKNKPMVALTFDDGPYTPVTKKILATLEKNQAKATFFCVGNRIPKYQSVVKQAYNQGCQVASHTYAHAILTKIKKGKSIQAQVDKANNEVRKLIGCNTTALRPPGGLVNNKVRKNVKTPMICWNVDSEDWKSRNTKKILKRCKSIKDGDIVLMHDLYPTTAKAIENLIPKLKKKEFQLVTIDELFYYKGIKLQPGKVYFSGR